MEPISLSPIFKAFARPTPPAINVESVCIAPLGSEVVPDV